MANIGWIIVFVGAGILFAIIGVWRMLTGKKSEYKLQESAAIDNWQNASFVLGVLLCLVGALLMFEGSVLGERTTGIATVIGIVGIGLIAQRRRA